MGTLQTPLQHQLSFGPTPAPATAAPTRAPITAATMKSGVFQFPTATFTGPLLEGPSRSSVGDLPVTNSADYPAHNPASVSTAFSVLTFVSLTITSQPNSQYPTETQTRRGPPALTNSSSTISRTTVSLTPAGESALTIGTDTYASTLADPTATSTPTGRLALAIGTDTYAYSINSASDHINGSQTITLGARVTVGSETIWLAAGATTVVIKSRTGIETVAMGAYVVSRFGIVDPSATLSATIRNWTALFIRALSRRRLLARKRDVVGRILDEYMPCSFLTFIMEGHTKARLICESLALITEIGHWHHCIEMSVQTKVWISHFPEGKVVLSTHICRFTMSTSKHHMAPEHKSRGLEC